MIHQYKLKGHNVVIDVYSGSIHVVDDVAYDIIRLFCDAISEDEILERVSREHRVSKEEVRECIDDIEELRAEGKLFSEDIFRPNAAMLKERHTDIKALCLHVSHACDLTCSYCFAGQGRFKGPASLMSEEVGKRAIDFLIENSGDRHNLEVDFFGGEPLLNFDVVKSIVKYARGREEECNKNFRFTLTTNGMGIDDEVIDFANRECHNVVLSLDGRKEVHDRERRAAGSMVPDEVCPGAMKRVERGTGSYDIIVPKFQRMVAARTGRDCGSVKVSDIPEWVTRGTETGNTGYYMRGTFTHYNPDFTQDIFHMTELGFDELSMEPVVAPKDSEFALSEDDLPILLRQYEILAEEMLCREEGAHRQELSGAANEGYEGKRPFTFYHYMLDLSGGPCIYKRISGCGSGTEYFAVTPQGELYPCHQFVGEGEYLMGDIWKGIVRTEIRDEFKMCNVYARKDCDDCWAKLYCSGGCAANAYHATGSILGTYDYGCELFKKRIECAIMMQVERSEMF